MVEKNNETEEVWGSNTHTGTPQLITTCLDYFTFRFDRGYQDEPESFKNLFKILKVDPTQAERKAGLNGYESRLLLAPGITLYYGGVWTQTCLGQNTTVLELKGSGCREFEERNHWDQMSYGCIDRLTTIGEMWLELFDECLKLGGVCTRIDMPVDDFTGNIRIDEIKTKVERKEYTTRMKKIEEASSYIDKDQYASSHCESNQGLNDYVSMINSKNKGYSITFGNRSNVQLCIYDKAAEQHNKDQSLDVKSWIRFETRFYHKNADFHFKGFYMALEDNQESFYIVSALKSVFEFKEPNHSDEKHLYRVKTWSKWLELTEGCEKIDLFSLPIVVKNIDITAAWIMNNVSKAFSKVVLSLPEDVSDKEIMFAVVARGLSKLTNNDLAEINGYRRKIGQEEFKNIKELKNYYYYHADLPDSFHPEVIKLLIEKKTRGRASKKESQKPEQQTE